MYDLFLFFHVSPKSSQETYTKKKKTVPMDMA